MTEKYYQLGTHNAEQFNELHDLLCETTDNIANIPNRECTCFDHKVHSPTRGTFMLTDEEATALKADSRIKFINIDYTLYPDDYKPPPEELQASSVPLLNRYQGTVKVYREHANSDTLPATPDATDVNRAPWSLTRHAQKRDPWVENGQADNYVYESSITQYGDGLDVDVIVADDGAGWMGHPEFQNNCTDSVAPEGYTGGNVLAGNGTCDILDLILDGPLYLDPDYFNPTPATFSRGIFGAPGELSNYTLYTGQDRNGSGGGLDAPLNIYVGDTLRISNTSPDGNHPLYIKTAPTAGTDDLAPNTTGQGAINSGTVVFTPTEAGTYYYQCSTHANMGGTITVVLGDKIEERWDGTIVPKEANARLWWQSTAYRSSVFNTKFPNAGATTPMPSTYTRSNCNGSNTAQSAVGQHCTPCMALTYGRTQGWAYNANKWALNLYGTYGSDIERGFDAQKIFHNTKPTNSKYGTKDPTVSSNSWGYRATKAGGTNYYHFRGADPVSYTSEPTFISHMGTQGDAGRWKSEMKTNSLTTALDELCDSGVIFVCAAGNSNQKQVNWGHQDFDNYIATNATDTLEESSYSEFSVAVTGTTNRRGFPQQGGKTVDGDTGEVTYKTINIGALDDDYATGNKERKVGYSDRGEGIDAYFAADGILAANRSYTSEGVYPVTYPGFTANSGSGAGVPEDCAFSGTSAACPVGAGFISTLIGLNRNWTHTDVKNYLSNLDNQTEEDFYYGTESTSATDANWTDYPSLEGGPAKVGYQVAITQTTAPKREANIGPGLNIAGINLNRIDRFDRGR